MSSCKIACQPRGLSAAIFLKALLDLVAIDSGHIALDGAPHNNKQPRTGLAYLPERFKPPAFLSGRRYIETVTRLAGIALSERQLLEQCAALALDTDLLNASIATYSKGTAQKLGLLASIICGQRLLVLDEPMSGLDTQSRALLKTRLAMAKAAGVTVLMSTHLLSDAETLCDRIGVIVRGSMRFVGSSDEFIERYRASNLEMAYLSCVAA